MVAIVNVNVSLLTAPAPNTLQQSGAIVSCGGTTLAVNTLRLVTQMSDIQPYLRVQAAIASFSWSNGVMTVTTAAPHNIAVGQAIYLSLNGQTPALPAWVAVTITGATTFNYGSSVNPGTVTVPGFYNVLDASELQAALTTFYAQGIAQSFYVLELGAVGDTSAISVLTTWLQNNPNQIYSFLMPRWWGATSTTQAAALVGLAKQYNTPTSKLYFWVTLSTNTDMTMWNGIKSVITLVEPPGIGQNSGTVAGRLKEFSMAAPFYRSLAYRPSNTNRVAPFCFSYCYGVTPYPLPNNGTLLQQYKNLGINVIATGAEGGLTNSMIEWGTTMDLRDFTYWYSVDYTQIQAAQWLAWEVITGSNNSTNPLKYNQFGINRLQARLAWMMQNEITFGLAEGTVRQVEMDGPAFGDALETNQFSNMVVINAVPFVPYATANPSDYKTGVYRGLTIVYIPSRGFTQIYLNIVASDFVIL
jgi:hypothetical protein